MSATLPAPFQPQSHISAIICTHNRDRYLANAIESLLIQTCENYEILIIDNASTDLNSTAKITVTKSLPSPSSAPKNISSR